MERDFQMKILLLEQVWYVGRLMAHFLLDKTLTAYAEEGCRYGQHDSSFELSQSDWDFNKGLSYWSAWCARCLAAHSRPWSFTCLSVPRGRDWLRLCEGLALW